MMGSSNQSNNDVYLPDEILIDILSRLRTKSLLRFRSVSKSFKNLIDQPLFISIHQSRSFSNLLIHHSDCSIQGAKFLLFNETLSNSHNLNLTPPVVYSLISAPCNGIVAISNQRERMGLWNLATRQFRSLPVPNRPKLNPFSWNPHIADCILGFGYDPNSNDYKVVLYRLFKDGYCETAQLLVYFLSTNSWSELDLENLYSFWDTDCSCLYQRRGICFNGVYYWFLSKSRQCLESILTFNFNDEKFREMAMPDPSLDLKSSEFAVSGSCLAVVGCYGKYLTKVRVWVMMENEFWVQKFEIGPFERIERTFGLWKNDYVLLGTSKTLILADSCGQLREIHSFGTDFYGLIQMFVYGESLVSVKGGGDHGNCSNQEDSLADFLSGTSAN